MSARVVLHRSRQTGLLCTVVVLLAALPSLACSNSVFPGATTWSTDGPVMVSGLTPRSAGQDAGIVGTVAIDVDCIELRPVEGEASRGVGETVGIGWPAGTSWDEAEEAVLLADGRRIRDGDAIRGGGGGFQVKDPEDLHPKIKTAIQNCGTESVVLLNGDPKDIEID